MIIKGIKTNLVTIPLKKPFKTALRVVTSVENLIVEVFTEEGLAGFGSCAPTAVITGDTIGSMKTAIEDFIAPAIVGRDLMEFDDTLWALDRSILRNTSAKAAVDMALYDLRSKSMGVPLHVFLGSGRNKVQSDMTVSVDEPQIMAADALAYVAQGYKVLKTKVGTDARLDIERVKAIREAVGKDIVLRLDANQGWNAKEAIRTIRRLEDMGMDMELVEQPVKAHDIDGLALVTASVDTPIMADESLFSPYDASKLLATHAVDLLNIKLMKSGGIHQALRINAISESYGIQCMVGCMIENNIGITAAAHLAAGKPNITRVDLDATAMMATDPIVGGAVQEGPELILSESPGLGITGFVQQA